jgi:predicted  nucleic acid-binding Zn-ribbon protein
MPRYDFRCLKCGTVFEKTVPSRVICLPCHECNKDETTYEVAERLLCCPSVIAIH